MKKKSAHSKHHLKSKAKIKSSKKRFHYFKGGMGAGMLYAVVALLIVGLGGSLMIGNITPLTSGSIPTSGRQPVLTIAPVTDKEKSNLQLFTFPGVTYTPTPAPTTPPQPQQKWDTSGGSDYGDSDKGDYGGGDKDGGGGSCFVKGTQILMSNGAQKNIEDVKVGDEIKGYDGNKIIDVAVLEVEAVIRNHHYNITFDNNTILGLTNEHPLYTDKGWRSISPKATLNTNPDLVSLSVQELKTGDKVLSNSGEYNSVVSIEFIPGDNLVFNLHRVTGYNNFYANSFLAHNRGSPGGGGGGGGSSGGGGGGSSGGGGGGVAR